ncbi:phosphatase PAP2 family protein [Thomasclavelia sp.]
METIYQSMLQNIRKSQNLQKIIISFTRYIPIITFIVYPSLIIYLLYTKNNLLAQTIWKPLISFLIVTIFRKIINRKRPYESMDINPLVKHKQGESFPSRHTVSAFAIALVCLNVNLPFGIIMLILAVIVSASRILCGVHYISDVLSAIIIALLINLI